MRNIRHKDCRVASKVVVKPHDDGVTHSGVSFSRGLKAAAGAGPSSRRAQLEQVLMARHEPAGHSALARERVAGLRWGKTQRDD